MKDGIWSVEILKLLLFRTRNVPDNSCGENQSTHFMFSNLSLEIRAVYEKMRKKYCRDGQTTDGDMAHAHCMLNY